MAIIAGLNMSPVSRLKKTVRFLSTLNVKHFPSGLDQGLEFGLVQFVFIYSGTKFSRPSSPSWSIRWIRRRISAATDRPWRQPCGDRPVLRTSASELSSPSFRYLSRISISSMKDAPIGTVLSIFRWLSVRSFNGLIYKFVGYRMDTLISRNSGSWPNK